MCLHAIQNFINLDHAAPLAFQTRGPRASSFPLRREDLPHQILCPFVTYGFLSKVRNGFLSKVREWFPFQGEGNPNIPNLATMQIYIIQALLRFSFNFFLMLNVLSRLLHL